MEENGTLIKQLICVFSSWIFVNVKENQLEIYEALTCDSSFFMYVCMYGGM